jgi:YD repeat-containing protein
VGTNTQNRKLALAASLSALAFANMPMPAIAQVAPTGINEPAVDEFGLERKTGRFSWSSHEIIDVGGDDSGLEVVTTGVSNNGWVETKWSANGTLFNLNQPDLSSYAAADPSSPISGGVSQNRFKRTVSYFGGSETFDCTPLGCDSEYLTGSTLAAITNGFLFTNTQGVKVYFEAARNKIVYPDGREIAYEAGKFRKNNFGYMLKISGAATYQAVNQATDYCDPNSTAACATLSATRSASITTPSAGTSLITDAAGGVTTLRWGNKTAKRMRVPLGASATLRASITTITERYPLGVTLPGDTTESVTIVYNNIDATNDPHDDIRVTSITKHGVTASYQHIATYPYGRAEAPPEQNGDGGGYNYTGIVVNGRIDAKKIDATLRNSLYSCAGGNADACSDIQGNSGGGWDLPPNVLNYPYQQAPNDEPGMTGSAGNDQYYLHTKTFINSVMANESFALKPEGTFGRSRRRLLNVTDALGRNTDFHHSTREEFAGVIHPEGNESFNDYDERGNISKITVKPKPGSGLPTLFTTYTYPVTCTPTTMATCNKPLSVTDPKGNVTEFTYNSMGQVLTETKPAPVPGAVRPKVTNIYTMRTAYIKGAGGTVIAAGPPISMLTQSSSCISLASCSGTIDEVRTDYDYGPTTGLNNLRLRGVAVTAANSAGQLETLRTCYTYNYFGEKVSETKPLGTGSVCP